MILPKESATFFKLPIQLFKGVSYPELALVGKYHYFPTTSVKMYRRDLQDCQRYTSSETLEDSEEGIELNVGFSVFQTGYIGFLCADTLCKLFLR